jgi:hypothetical protein
MAVRAVIRTPSATGAQWDPVIVGWLPDPGQLFCDACPTARDCEHIQLVREALTDRTSP